MPQQGTSSWKDVKVSYDYDGKKIEEKFRLTRNVEGQWIVILPTAKRLLATQPGEACNWEQLRQDAIHTFLSLGGV
jgi:hypothetical protein